MRILVLNGASGDAAAVLVEHPAQGLVPVRQAEPDGRAGAERLAGRLEALLQDAGWSVGSLGLIAVVTGPGSFTGLRATLSLAHGLALGGGAALVGVALAEALRRTVGETGGRPLWCVGHARRDRIFLECEDGAGPRGVMLDAMPVPAAPVLLAGDASTLVAARLPHATSSGTERPDPVAIARVALDRLAGRLSPLAALPL